MIIFSIIWGNVLVSPLCSVISWALAQLKLFPQSRRFKKNISQDSELSFNAVVSAKINKNVPNLLTPKH